jgi:hypothetical protein
MKEPFEIEMYRNTEIELHYDTNSQSPNDWDNDTAFLIYDHSDFATAPYGMKPSDADDIFERWSKRKRTYFINGYYHWIFPVFAYIHGGVSLYLSRSAASMYEPSGFDTSFKGFVLVTRQRTQFWCREDAFKYAGEILKEWNQYNNGEVYGYVTKHGSCWGFYGDDGKKQMIEEAKSEIDHAMNRRMKEKIVQLKTFIKNKVPLTVREQKLITVE